MAKWLVAAKKADFEGIGKEFGISPVLARIIRNRDLIEKEEIRKYLNGSISELYDPFLLKDMDKAVVVLAGKIVDQKKIRVIGDYDVDGICAAHILLKGLRELGGIADTVIPHRMKDGYGLNDHLIADAGAAGVDTILTCDNGIAAAPQVAAARELGMTVIVTDHHEVPYEENHPGARIYHLPAADAVVDPKQPGCTYPYQQICGGAVALKVIEALYRRMLRTIPERLLEELRCLAAFATICDVMELRDENRILVKYGLEHMRDAANPGLRALIEVNGIQDRQLSPYHIGFVLGPCLNATGRLDTAERAMALLGAGDYPEAVTIAGELKELNESRKEMTALGVAEAVTLVEEKGERAGRDMDKAMDKVLVLFLPRCHESLAGIIAGRIRERYGRPVFILTRGEEGVKGSGRSIEAYHMYEEMCKCRELFTKFGGHKMAAGLSMQEADIEELRLRLNENAVLTTEDFQEKIHIDVPLPLSLINREFILELDRLEPFGVGNAKPVFARKNIRLLMGVIMGKNRNVGKYTVSEGEAQRYEIIFFGDLEAFHCFLAEKYSQARVDELYAGGQAAVLNPMEISMAYYPQLNRYMGRESVQLVMTHYS